MLGLDLFCSAGGMSAGFVQAGYMMVGSDLRPQKHYPYTFHQDNALCVLDTLLNGKQWNGYSLDDFAFIHASPPCQAFSVAGERWRQQGKQWINLIEPTRQRLIATGKPYVIENVMQAPLRDAVVLCGSMFDLRVLRHRQFETNWGLMAPGPCQHRGTVKDGYYFTVAGHGVQRDQPKATQAERRAAMGIDWMNRNELAQAIPPAYARYIGEQLKEVLILAA